MKKLILASTSAIALLGLAACSDTDNTTTQSTTPPAETTTPPAEPQATPPAEPAPSGGTTAPAQ